MTRLRSLWAWSISLVATFLFAVGAIATCWIPPRGRLYLLWARGWARAVLTFAGIPVHVEEASGVEGLPVAIYMANHESVIDILVLFLAIRKDVRFLAKRSLFFIPFLGWSMALAGFVPVDRERKEKAKGVFGTLEKRLAQGRSILVFPEGTRSRTGQLGSFKKSGFLLAMKSGIPIVPIGITGAREVLGADGFLVHPGDVRVRVGEPVPTAGVGVSHRRDLMERVRSEILRLTSRM